jgi:hypothetical protein
MRTLLVLVAAVALPFNALAQPVADEGKSTAVSSVTVEAVTPCAPADSWRPNAWFDAPPDNTKITRSGESPGTRAWAQKYVDLLGRPTMIDPPEMTAGLRKAAESQFPRMHQGFACFGALKSIKLLHVSAKGADVFEFEFANGALEWAVAPLNARGQVEAALVRWFTPQPVSMRFNAFLRSLERGRPDYSDLAPDSAAAVRAQWPTLQKTVKDWGRLKVFYFLRQDEDGSYAYRATYEHRQVVWTVGPPNADGKFGAVTYDEKAG